MYKIIISSMLCLFAWQVWAVSDLQEELNEFVDQYIDEPKEQRKINTAKERGVQHIAESGILEKAINVGDYAPEFVLTNAVGEEISLYDTLLSGPVVLVWYRGGWCPYCNLQLQQIQQRLDDIKAAGGQVLAISPELPDKGMTLRERHNLEFQVLSDVNNKVADRYNLAYSVPSHVVDQYDLSYTLNEYNGADAKERLPLAVTYVISRSGLVEYAFLDADYAKRAKPDDIIEALKRLNK
jgi:peroxiredoxin